MNENILRYNGTAWVPGTEGSFGLFASNTALAPASPGAPTNAEVLAFAGSNRDKFVFYTGTDTISDPETYVWYLDRAGSLILLKSPSAAAVVDSVRRMVRPMRYLAMGCLTLWH